MGHDQLVSRYIDLSGYKDKPVPRLKELFTFWKEKASWQHPSIIVFDNIDAIVSAEVEVHTYSLIIMRH